MASKSNWSKKSLPKKTKNAIEQSFEAPSLPTSLRPSTLGKGKKTGKT